MITLENFNFKNKFLYIAISRGQYNVFRTRAKESRDPMANKSVLKIQLRIWFYDLQAKIPAREGKTSFYCYSKTITVIRNS